MSNEWKFGDSFPSIEIDTEYWKTLSASDRIKYLVRLTFQEKDFSSRLNVMNYMLSTVNKVSKTFIKNAEVTGYLDLIEQSTNLIAVSSTIGNVFKAKQKYKNTKNNEIAKLMGFPNGNYVNSLTLDATHSMFECLLDIKESQQSKYDIKIDQIIDDDANSESKDASAETSIAVKNFKIIGTKGADLKFALTVKTIVNDDTPDSTSTTMAHLFYPVSGMSIHPDELKDLIITMMLEMYISKVDTTKNFLAVNGSKLEIQHRVHIAEEVTNVPIERITKAIKKVLKEETRRGLVLVGEPGVGKTISLHKIINTFKDRLVFWVAPDSINTVNGIRNTFKIFKLFKNSIIIFDDLDSAPLTAKDEITNEFLKHLDGKNNKDLTGYFIATVNDPSKIHMAVINRPERFDDVVPVDLPKTVAEISALFFGKAKEKGYYTEADAKNAYNITGRIKFGKENKDFHKLAERVIENNFTQVMVAGLVNDCHAYTDIDNCEITIKLLTEAVENRLKSIHTANLVATKGRLSFNDHDISDDAKASMNRHR